MLLNPFKGFDKVDRLESKYNFSAKIPSKSDQALYTKVGGGFNKKYLIKTISKESSKSFTPEEKKLMENQIRVQQADILGVLSVLEALETDDNYYIVQEYYEGGDLELKKRNVDQIPEKNCAHIVS
jgi:calcium-dependent protein kinase